MGFILKNMIIIFKIYIVTGRGFNSYFVKGHMFSQPTKPRTHCYTRNYQTKYFIIYARAIPVKYNALLTLLLEM